MRPNLDLTGFLTIIPQSRFWEAYVQGRRAIHVEYGNLDSVEPQLKLTPIDRWGARITAFDRKDLSSMVVTTRRRKKCMERFWLELHLVNLLLPQKHKLYKKK